MLEGHSNWVCAIDVSPSGHRLYSCSKDKKIRAWHLRGEEEMGREMVDVLEEVGLFGALEVRGLLCIIATCLVGGDALFEQILAVSMSCEMEGEGEGDVGGRRMRRRRRGAERGRELTDSEDAVCSVRLEGRKRRR